MKSKPKIKPGRIVKTEYLSAENLEEQAEGELLTEWLNGLTISARLTLAARLLNFTYEDMRPKDTESHRMRMEILALAEECSHLTKRMASYQGDVEIL
jgi:hypothetical protein